MSNEEKVNVSELVEQIAKLTAERDELKGSLEEVNGKVTELEANEIRLNRIVASTVLSTKQPEATDVEQTKSFGDLYAETIKEMMKND